MAPKRKRNKNNIVKKRINKKRKLKMEQSESEPQHTCPISQEPIEKKYLCTIKFEHSDVLFHYDVRNILEHIQRSKDPKDPMTRISYSNKQLKDIRKIAVKSGCKVLSKLTLQRLWKIEDIFKNIKTQVMYDNCTDLIEQIENFIECSSNIVKELDDSKGSTEVYSNIRDESILFERNIFQKWNIIRRTPVANEEEEEGEEGEGEGEEVKEEKGVEIKVEVVGVGEVGEAIIPDVNQIFPNQTVRNQFMLAHLLWTVDGFIHELDDVS